MKIFFLLSIPFGLLQDLLMEKILSHMLFLPLILTYLLFVLATDGNLPFPRLLRGQYLEELERQQPPCR